jgi:hypothetical protein
MWAKLKESHARGKVSSFMPTRQGDVSGRVVSGRWNSFQMKVAGNGK